MSEIAREEEARQRNLVRAVAREEITTLIEARQLLSEQHSHSFRWLMASLLAINGGAVVAALNSDAIAPITKVTSGAVFGVGIGLALMVAYSSQKLTNFVSPLVQERIGYWLGVLEDGELDEEIEEAIVTKAKRVLRFKCVPEIFGWLSFLAFFTGLGLIASALLAPTSQSVIVAVENLSSASSSEPNPAMTDNPTLSPLRQPEDQDAALRLKSLGEFVRQEAVR